MLLDGYPKGFLSYLTRTLRWIRGDYQIIGYLKRESGLSKLSKFKILDNIRRSLLEITAIIVLTILLFQKMFYNTKVWIGILAIFVSLSLPSILEVICSIVYRKENVKKQRRFTKSIDGLKGSLYRGIISIVTLPTRGYRAACAIIKTIYRMTVTREHLLEWTTAAEAEKQDNNNVEAVFGKMMPNIIYGLLLLGAVTFASCNMYFRIFVYIFASLNLLAPIFMWQISKEKNVIKKVNKLTKEEKIYIEDVAKRTWEYFSDFMNKENSYIPPDNFQESRREKIVFRTSSTNIGLALLTIISAYDLKFITLEKTVINLENTLETIKKLEKWNGHLY